MQEQLLILVTPEQNETWYFIFTQILDLIDPNTDAKNVLQPNRRRQCTTAVAGAPTLAIPTSNG